MPFEFDPAACKKCRFGYCVEDRRKDPVKGRKTVFRIKQQAAFSCTFEAMVPGFIGDAKPDRQYAEYLAQFQSNVMDAGKNLFARAFEVNAGAVSKVGGDVFEILEAAALWEAAAAWNNFMDTGKWKHSVLKCPEGAVATPARKVAVVKLPRNFDATLLFNEPTRATFKAHQSALKKAGLELRMSSPDIVGVRLPEVLPPRQRVFMKALADLDLPSQQLVETAYNRIEGTLTGREFLLAMAVKTTTRSDRLYQPLYEANVLKYIVRDVLRGSSFRFHAHLGSVVGADVAGHYEAASLQSLMHGGQAERAIDRLIEVKKPAQIAQAVLDEFPLFPH